MMEYHNDLISIVVPIYNAEAYLDECIQSIRNQTYGNLQIILVNDGSKDGSLKICKNHETEDKRIKVIDKENGGVVRARKTGMTLAKGKYATVIDADDWLEPDMIEKMYNCLTDHNVEMVMCGRFEEFDSYSKAVYHGLKPGQYSKDEMLAYVYPNMIVNNNSFFEWGIFPSIWDKLMLTEKLKEHLEEVNDGLPIGNDAACIYPLLLDVDSIYIMDECLYHYRQVEGSIVHNINRNQRLKEGFMLLYRNGMEQLNSYSEKYDVSSQWLTYVMFLALPRVYSFNTHIGDYEDLFPYEGVKKNNKVAVYGLGLFGKQMVNFLLQTGFCDVVVGIDRNYKSVKLDNIKVIPPEDIVSYEVDSVIICSSYEKQTKSMVAEISKYTDPDKVKVPKLSVMLEQGLDVLLN